jgi:hypothetical protein
MQLAGPGVFGPPRDRQAALAVLRAAIEAGVNHIDTSDFYGPHVTNQLIREALHPYADDLVIVTKVGAVRGADASWNQAFSAEQLRQAVHDNLRNLGLERLEVVNLRAMFDVHGPAEGSLDEALSTLAELQQQGLIRHIGLSNVTARQVADARRICRIACVQNQYNPRAPGRRRPDRRPGEGRRALRSFLPAGRLFAAAIGRPLESCTRTGRHADAGGPGLAAAPLPQHPADSGHLVGGAPAGEPGGWPAGTAAARDGRTATGDGERLKALQARTRPATGP